MVSRASTPHIFINCYKFAQSSIFQKLPKDPLTHVLEFAKQGSVCLYFSRQFSGSPPSLAPGFLTMHSGLQRMKEPTDGPAAPFAPSAVSLLPCWMQTWELHTDLGLSYTGHQRSMQMVVPVAQLRQLSLCYSKPSFLSQDPS